MKNVFDYLDYYNDISFDECDFNDMDNIVFSCLAYLPLKNINKKDSISIKEVSKIISENNAKDLRLLSGVAVRIIQKISCGKRYENTYFCNIESILDDITQFCAITFRFAKGKCYVAFKGTDNSLSGWRENLELSYKYPTVSQSLAISYLKKTIKFSDKVVYVGGHSKGGNLAMASVMETDMKIYNKIKMIYNNDGPGFLKKEYDSFKYKMMARKLKTFIPEESVVGILLLNSGVKVVKSREIGAMQHNLATWDCFGQFLINGRLSKASLKVQEQINAWNEKTDNKNKELMIKTLFDILEESGIKYFYQIKDLKFTEVSSMIKKANGIDEEAKEILIGMIKGLLFTNKETKGE